MLSSFLGLGDQCFKDSGRLFPFQVANDDEGLTIEKCKKLCFEDNQYEYAGVQHAMNAGVAWATTDPPKPLHPSPSVLCHALETVLRSAGIHGE